MSKKILLKRSNQKESNGQPKLPLPSQMDYGELAINYAKDAETLSIKNSDNKIVTFNKINIIQTSGSSASNVMSQDAVTTELNKKADKATTLAGYGIIDAKIEDGSITIGKETIKPLTSVPTEYVTDDELSAKGYQTASQVSSAISRLVDSAPESLNTLNELAAALGDDPNFATTIINQIAQKADASELNNYATKTALTSGLEGKADTSHSHKAYQISGLDAHRALISDGGGVIASSAITSTELEYLDGVTSNIQTQLNNKASSTSVEQTISDAAFNNGHNAVSSINNIPISKKLVIATIKNSGNFALSSTPSDGREIQVIVHNTNSSDINITMPEDSKYIKMSGNVLTVGSNLYANINVISDGTNMYIKPFLQAKSGSEIEPFKSAPGDLCFYDRTAKKLIIVDGDTWNSASYPSSRYVPIGIVVVPGIHNVYGNGSCGVMSLKEMNCNTPNDGGITHQTMAWGGYGVDTSLTNLDTIPYIGTGTNVGKANSTVIGTSNSGYLPSDSFSSVQCPHDIDTYYDSNRSTSEQCPSPYLTDGSRNSAYYQTNSPSSSSNAFADFNGTNNTQTLLRLATSQSNWRTASSITNDGNSGYYPAACCCWRYSTEGTSQGNWYLPSCGEMGYAVPYLNKINEIIHTMCITYGSSIGVELYNSGSYWMSTEKDNNYAWTVGFGAGFVGNSASKNYTGYTRAWLRV